MEVIYGSGGIPGVIPSVIPSMALDMYRSPHLTIPYLLKDEQGDLKDKSQG